MEIVETGILVIGGGAAGMAAAYAADRAGVPVLLAEKSPALGGVLRQCVHDGFGTVYFGKNMTGQEYMRAYLEKLKGTNVQISAGTAIVSLGPDKRAVASADGRMFGIRFSECVLAAGCRERSVWSLPVCGTRPEGVYTAGYIQEKLNIHNEDIAAENIVILGSGDIGQVVAKQLLQGGKNIKAIVEIRDRLGGSLESRRRWTEQSGIPLMLRSTIDEISGSGRLSSVTVCHLDTGVREKISCDLLISSLGLIPERDLLKNFHDGIPEWVHLCGNAEHVHSLVDAVTVHGEELGERLCGIRTF